MDTEQQNPTVAQKTSDQPKSINPPGVVIDHPKVSLPDTEPNYDYPNKNPSQKKSIGMILILLLAVGLFVIAGTAFALYASSRK